MLKNYLYKRKLEKQGIEIIPGDTPKKQFNFKPKFLKKTGQSFKEYSLKAKDNLSEYLKKQAEKNRIERMKQQELNKKIMAEREKVKLSETIKQAKLQEKLKIRQQFNNQNLKLNLISRPKLKKKMVKKSLPPLDTNFDFMKGL